jgi:hypothetical protein
VALRVKSDDYAECPTNGTSAAQRAKGPVQNVVPDAALAEADLSVYAEPAQAIAENKTAYPLYTVYAGVDGEDHEEQIAYTSRSYMPPYLVELGVA